MSALTTAGIIYQRIDSLPNHPHIAYSYIGQAYITQLQASIFLCHFFHLCSMTMTMNDKSKLIHSSMQEVSLKIIKFSITMKDES